MDNISLIRDGTTILDNIQWKVNKGENWGIIGPNGAGKSFMLYLLYLNIYPSKGSLQIMDNTLGQVNIWELKKHIGYVSGMLQENYHRNIAVEKVIYSGFFSSNGLYKEINQEILDKTDYILDFLKISHLSKRLYGTLSQGEKKKVLIGRSLVFEPSILLFDEPCSGLDIGSREEFLSTVEKLSQENHTIIFVTHFIDEIIPSINKILCLKDGKIFKEGTKPVILNPDCLTSLFNYPVTVKKNKDRFEIGLNQHAQSP